MICTTEIMGPGVYRNVPLSLLPTTGMFFLPMVLLPVGLLWVLVVVFCSFVGGLVGFFHSSSPATKPWATATLPRSPWSCLFRMS